MGEISPLHNLLLAEMDQAHKFIVGLGEKRDSAGDLCEFIMETQSGVSIV